MTILPGQTWRTLDLRRTTTITIEQIDGDTIHARTGDKTRQLTVEQLTRRYKRIAQPPIDGQSREDWLATAVGILRSQLFTDIDTPVPPVHVSVGWPGGRGKKANVIGQCWHRETSEDKINQIFISPILGGNVEVLATLTHELIHAMDNGQSGHKGFFAATAHKLGFLKPYTKVLPGDNLHERLEEIASDLPKYPHAKITPHARPAVQKTYMVLVTTSKSCTECDPKYKLRMTKGWIEDVGTPLCPHGIEMEAKI